MLENQSQPANPDRRKALGKLIAGGAALAAGTAILSNEEHVLAEKLASDNAAGANGAKDVKVDALSGASRIHTNWGKLSDLKKPMSKATIKGVELSRLIMGGNLVGGWAHSRDLTYVSSLVKAYHTRDKIIATFKMAEACGINTYLSHQSHIGIMKDYWEKADGTMRYIADCGSPKGGAPLDVALNVLDKGGTAVYIQGATNDRLVREGKFDEIAKFVERIRKEDAIVGLGGHYIETIKACVEKGIEPDFWMKTIHSGNYWSRMADKPENGNVFDRKPEETIAFMNTLKQPWIGFKVLAAGAIKPQDGFRFALEAGADFMCVGMYDFQIVDDVNLCMNLLQSDLKRTRPWCFT